MVSCNPATTGQPLFSLGQHQQQQAEAPSVMVSSLLNPSLNFNTSSCSQDVTRLEEQVQELSQKLCEQTKLAKTIQDEESDNIRTLKNENNLLIEFMEGLDRFYSNWKNNNQSVISDLMNIVESLCDNDKKLTFNENYQCRRCGLPSKHKLKDCPAFELDCFKCGRENHIGTMCLSADEDDTEPTLEFSEDMKKKICHAFERQIGLCPLSVFETERYATYENGVFTVTAKSFEAAGESYDDDDNDNKEFYDATETNDMSRTFFFVPNNCIRKIFSMF